MKQIDIRIGSNCVDRNKNGTFTIWGHEIGVHRTIKFVLDGEQIKKIKYQSGGDLLSLLVEDNHFDISNLGTPSYQVININPDHYFYIEMDLLDLPEVIPTSGHQEYPVRGIVTSGSMKGQEITVICGLDVFVNHRTPREEDIDKFAELSKVPFEGHMLVTLKKGEPVILKGCVREDNGTLKCKGRIEKNEFDANATVILIEYKSGYSTKPRFVQPSLFDYGLPPHFRLTVKFNSGHLEGLEEVVVIGSSHVRGKDLRSGSEVALQGLYPGQSIGWGSALRAKGIELSMPG